MKTNRIALIFTTAMAALIATTMAAFAVPAVATGAVNVRTGPGVGFTRLDTLFRGERVNVTQCQNGWCYVEKSGPNGWVSGNYLTRTPNVPGHRSAPNNPAVNFGLTFGSGGSSFSISIGNSPRRPIGRIPSPKVCFYNGPNYTGANFCVNAGSSNNQLTGFWNNRISSVKVFGGANLQLCRNRNYRGACYNINTNRPNLPIRINNKATSFQTWN